MFVFIGIGMFGISREALSGDPLAGPFSEAQHKAQEAGEGLGNLKTLAVAVEVYYDGEDAQAPWNKPFRDARGEEGPMRKAVLAQAINFFSGIGRPGIELSVAFVSADFTKKEIPLAKDRIYIVFAPMEKLLENFRMTLYVVGGESLVKDLDAEIRRAVDDHKKGRDLLPGEVLNPKDPPENAKWSSAFSEQVIRAVVVPAMEEKIKSHVGGFGSLSSRIVFIFPDKRWIEGAKSSVELRNIYTFVVCHELAHVLGLEHDATRSDGGKRNLMDMQNNDAERREAWNFSVGLTPDQAKKIYVNIKDMNSSASLTSPGQR